MQFLLGGDCIKTRREPILARRCCGMTVRRHSLAVDERIQLRQMEQAQERDRRARVFISCGQRKGSDEIEIARKIQTKLVGLGFDAWFAEEVQ
jgi:hypothetical protein